jgi:hypothetical protein
MSLLMGDSAIFEPTRIFFALVGGADPDIPKEAKSEYPKLL